MPHPIEHIKAFLSIPEELEETMYQKITLHTFKRGDIISDMGNMRCQAYFIKSGSARTYYILGGKEYTFSFSFEDEFIAQSIHLYKNTDMQSGIEFLEESEVYVLPHVEMSHILDDFTHDHYKQVFAFLTTILMEQTCRLEERITVLQNASAPERLQWLINRYPKILERVTLTQIASYLGVTKETLYRIRGNKYNSHPPKNDL
ncbi:MAG: Crp/Fnr family transcriptional regulator [Paramuribaculum sp.]|nr:Crp/Fnr family transcriptional regulator [Paramuribaculum sp.]